MLPDLKNIINDSIGINQFVPGAVCVIGDVHGCALELEELLRRCVYIYSPNRIYQLGDLIDRGPFLLRTFKLIEDCGVQLIIGNHELAFYNEVLGGKKCKSAARLKTHEQFQALKPRNQDFILESISKAKNRIDVSLDNGNKFVLTHAPLSYRHTNETNGGAALYVATREASITEPTVKNNVHGHMHWQYTDIYKQIEDAERSTYNIDSGCVYGQKLTALELSTMTPLQVSAQETYFSDPHMHE